MIATPAKLRDGTWGARVEGQVAAGDVVTITTRAGKSWDARVTCVLWTDGTVALCVTASTDRPSQPSASRSAGPARQGLALAKPGPGGLYKPDASPTKRRCARCGAPAMWIAGAGEALCVRHQDDY